MRARQPAPAPIVMLQSSVEWRVEKGEGGEADDSRNEMFFLVFFLYLPLVSRKALERLEKHGKRQAENEM
jgi:hypothetical protein